MLNIAPVQDALQRVGDSLRTKTAIGVGAVKPISDAASYVARNFGERAAIVAAFDPPVWASFAALWPALATALNPAATSDEAGAAAAATALAKLERNLLAGDATAQAEAISSEPDIRRLVFNVTTFTRIESAECELADTNTQLTPVAELHGVLAQLLCNLVSPREGNAESEALARGVLNVWLSGGRDDDVIIRLLESRDARANLGVLRLLLNLATPPGVEQLLSPVAIRWLAQILGRMDDWHASSTHGTCFDVGVALFARFFNAGLQERIFDTLKAPDEEITPSQTTLLKLLDAHLARGADDVATTPNPSPSPNFFVIPVWRGLAAYATQSMRSGQDDARLPGILAALVLATEILAGVVLAAQDMVAEMKGEATTGSSDDTDKSIISPLVDVLRATNEFLPRIKPTPTTPAENAALAAGMSLPEVQHRFANVKRDLVRLLAVLTYNDVRVGDMVREAGGVHLVLALCETDERNSYLREHALFAVRNLMTGNPANQAIIAEMDPLGVVGDDGELKPLPEHLKRSNDRAVAAGKDANPNTGGSSGTSGASGANISEI